MSGADLLALVVKGTLVLGAGLVAARLLERRSSALRHAALLVSIVAAAALPLLALSLPDWDPRPVAIATGPALPANPAPRALSGEAGMPEQATPVEASAVAADAEARGVPWTAGLVLVWMTGACLVLGGFLRDLARTQGLVADAVAAPEGSHALEAAVLARRLGVRRPVRVLFSERLTVPVTWGILRPVVVLPLAAWEWGPRRVRVVILHEIAHVARLDCLSACAAAIAGALWWFHPLLWICRRRLRIEQERACDDVVLLDGVGATAYASILVDFARAWTRFDDGAAGAAIAMARPSTLRDRIETILSASSRRPRLGRRAAAGIVLVGAALLLPLAAVRLWGESADARRSAEWIADLSSPDARSREAAVWNLGAIGGESATAELEARLSDPDPGVRAMAARALAKAAGEDAFDAVAALLRDPDPHVRELAILGVREIGGERLVPAIAPLLADREMGVRAVAISALVFADGRDAALALANVAERDPDPHVRGMALGGLAKRKDAAEVALPALVRLARDPDPGIRAGAASGLGTFAARSSAVDPLLLALRDPDGGVRLKAAEALGGSDDPRAAAALVAALHDPVHQVRLQSAWSLDAIEARR